MSFLIEQYASVIRDWQMDMDVINAISISDTFAPLQTSQLCHSSSKQFSSNKQFLKTTHWII